MTVVAANLKEIAGDSFVTCDGLTYSARKVFRLSDGSLIGIAGGGTHLEYVLDWLREGEPTDRVPKLEGEPNFSILRVKRDGIYLCCNSVIFEHMSDSCHAIGSGSDIALYAMRVLKMSPAKACHEAMKIIRSCGGKVNTLKLEKR